MRRRRWPDGAEQQRRDAIAAIRTIRHLAQNARKIVKIDPTLIEMMLADIEIQAADAERLLILAKLGERQED
jgi:aminoglycoside/choline kinase family phosphotransferase